MENILLLTVFLSYIAYVVAKCRREVHMMQQNSYFISRYSSWWSENIIKAISTQEVVGVLIGLSLFARNGTNFTYIVFILTFGVGAYQLFTKKDKKALVFTPRAKRLFAVMLFIFALLIGFIFWYDASLFLKIAPILAILSFGVLILASWLLLPIEGSINDGFVTDAKNRLKAMPNLKVIGITGSYGKTSVKHFVGRILSEQFNVLHTPGSVNTTLGVVRIIREQLKPTHEIFIAEMGAKKTGDVKELCDLVEPDIAILTAIGPEHLDTFGSMENVQKGNFELVESVNQSGFALLNADYDLVRQYPKENTRKVWYGLNHESAEYSASNMAYTATGMAFDFLHKGEKVVSVETKLLGEHNVSNIVSACAVAFELGMEPAKIAYAVRNLQPVQHRLEVKRYANGLTIIDDAFNSNPTGAAMAVDVLGKIQGNKKIIVTPGMIELGDLEFEANKTFGKQIAAVCDFTILVGPKQTLPIQEGLKEANYPENQLFIAKNLNEAVAKVNEIAGAGDVVLYENDLPDTYDE